MTLIGTLKCTDGFVIAADTAFERGDMVYQGAKIARYRAPDGRYDVFVAGCQTMAYAETASQAIERGLQTAQHDYSLEEIKKSIDVAINTFYDDHVYKYWHATGDFSTNMSLIIAVRNQAGEFGTFATENSTVRKVTSPTFDGSGAAVANFLAERFLKNYHGFNVANAVHVFGEIFRAAKKNSAGVGGSTEIYAVRVTEDAERFFMIPTMSLAALETNFYDAIRESLEMLSPMLESKISTVTTLLQGISKDANAGRDTINGRVSKWTDREDGTYGVLFSEPDDEC